MATDRSYIPATYDTGVIRGDYFARRFQFTSNSDIGTLATRARVQLRRRNGQLVDSFELGDGILISGDTVSWVIGSDRTAGYDPTTYEWDLELGTDIAIKTYIAGEFTVKKDITHE